MEGNWGWKKKAHSTFLWVIHPIDNRGPQDHSPSRQRNSHLLPQGCPNDRRPTDRQDPKWRPICPVFERGLREQQPGLSFQSLTSMTPCSRLLQMAQKLKEKWRVLCDFLTLWEEILLFLGDARDSPNSGTQKPRQSAQRRKVWLEKCYRHQIS